ncbi:hypothetical protein [Desulfolutivibrio sulfoxidireducens]|uniref:hypothetical protein n=1 Tax=Desulfolutivibrio sulfoxidireducens TaxID=2773299 RepID=UPI00159E0CB1|nr:hypothetical protein [Desulfolutivibrio sulfoxidireducens]QLA15534.1 hypothetical protein GD605_04955 [Desulfolutivibrio sulfoxidireducens]QLA19132.1 hypothetical protein GD604_04965 [Desulfolutivibrio sulfoxidireducens]
MPDCEMLSKCIFFNDRMANMPAMAEMMKKKYCRGDNAKCARYLVCTRLGREKVPADLSPAQIDRAEAMLR